MRPRIALLALLLIALLQHSASALEPARPDQGSFIKRAVSAAGRLWLLSDAGALSSVQLDSYVKVRQDAGAPVLDVCVGRHGVTIAVDTSAEKAWAIEHLAGGTWITDYAVAGTGDEFIALQCDANETTVLTNHRLITVDERGRRDVKLNKEFYDRVVYSVFGTAHDVFVGINAGEWGGGLRRIDRQTGRVTTIQHTVTNEICDGPLNTDCDPVTAVAIDPWNGECIVAAIGLVHMGMPHGRIDEICGATVRTVFVERYPHPYRAGCTMGSGEPCETEPFFGAAAFGDRIVAVADGGLYSISKDGTALHSSLPPFQAAGDVRVAYVPGFVLVLTDINQRTSVSGSAPLLVSR